MKESYINIYTKDLGEIFSYLSFTDLHEVNKVNRLFNHVSKQNNI